MILKKTLINASKKNEGFATFYSKARKRLDAVSQGAAESADCERPFSIFIF